MSRTNEGSGSLGVGVLSKTSTAFAALTIAYLVFAETMASALVSIRTAHGLATEWQVPQSVSEILNATPRLQKQQHLVRVAAVIALVAVSYWYYTWSKSRIFLVDFACYKPPKSLRISLEQFLWGSIKFSQDRGEAFQQESLDFQRRISQKNGLSDHTCLPASFHQDPPLTGLDAGREEAKMVLFGAVRELLARTGMKPRDFDFLVVNCSLFNPTPSLSAMVINHFKMRSDIVSYNLAGMGCSAGIISIDLANRLLKLSANKTALVLSTENMTQNWYTGADRSMLIPNTLFRMGAAAIVMTNKPSERHRAKYELQHVVRVHLGADDTAYECVYQREDAEGKVGVTLTKDIVKVAARALQANLTILAPLVLPWSELLKYGVDAVQRKLGLREGPPYQPNFGKAFNHFCLHAGGRGVIEGLGGQLALTKANLEPSFSSLYWYGNTSSASIWYGFGYAESKQGMRKGDKIWQVGFGSGFKTNSAVWRALRTFKDTRHAAWSEVSQSDTEQMWRELEGMGCYFVDGVMPPYEAKKKAKGAPSNDAASKCAAAVPKNGKKGPENGAPHQANGHHMLDSAARDSGSFRMTV